jgi:hypothetical protein
VNILLVFNMFKLDLFETRFFKYNNVFFCFWFSEMTREEISEASQTNMLRKDDEEEEVTS